MLESALPSPCYLIDQAKLKSNLMLLDDLRNRSGCRILFAQKAFSSFPFYSMISRYLDGVSSCSAYEAQLSRLFFHGENHVFQTAYLPEEIGDIVPLMCTEAFGYMTGSTILADGGLMLRHSGYAQRFEWREKMAECRRQEKEGGGSK